MLLECPFILLDELVRLTVPLLGLAIVTVRAIGCGHLMSRIHILAMNSSMWFAPPLEDTGVEPFAAI